MTENEVPHLLLDLLGDKQFWNAVFRSGVDLLVVLPLVILLLVPAEVVRGVRAERRRKAAARRG